MEMKYLGRVKSVTWNDRIRNDIGNELETESVIDRTGKLQHRRVGHLMRMNGNRPPNSIWKILTLKERDEDIGKRGTKK